MNLVWCACGRLVTYPGEFRCEDCWADDQARYHRRKVGNINTMAQSSREGCDVPIHAETRTARRGRNQAR